MNYAQLRGIVYKNGNIISGFQTFPDGSMLNYSKVKENPRYKNGEKEFYRFLMTNFIYPKEARNSSQGNYKISFEFYIQTDGTVTDIRSIPSLGQSVDRELTRVIKKSGTWIPGKVRGEPVIGRKDVTLILNIGPSTIIRQETQQIPNGIQSTRPRKSF